MISIFVGDCVGSRFEWENIKTKEFELFAENELFAEKSYLTDDSIMTLAIAEAILNAEKEHGKLSLLAVKYMQKLGRLYPVGYGTYLRMARHRQSKTLWKFWKWFSYARQSLCLCW